jgi:rhodanese-related sulfurtransferase
MIDQIRPADLSAWFAAAGTAMRPVLLDVREPWELQTAAVQPGEGFDLLAIPMGEIPARLADIPQDRPVACMCHHGARSQRVAEFLAQNGYSSLANIAGGIDAWSSQVDAKVPHY